MMKSAPSTSTKPARIVCFKELDFKDADVIFWGPIEANGTRCYFCVHKDVLRFSKVFSDMLEVGIPSDDKADGRDSLPCVALDDDAKSIYALFEVLYSAAGRKIRHRAPHSEESLRTLWLRLRMADKYDISSHLPWLYRDVGYVGLVLLLRT